MRRWVAVALLTVATANADTAVPVVSRIKIPDSCRTFNYTGSCVYHSVTLSIRYAEKQGWLADVLDKDGRIEKAMVQVGRHRLLVELDRERGHNLWPNYAHGGANPGMPESVLKRLKINYDATYKRDFNFIRKYLKAGYPICYGVRSHMLNIVGLDETAGSVWTLNNSGWDGDSPSDTPLRVTRKTIEEFKRTWTGWAIVILPDKVITPTIPVAADDVAPSLSKYVSVLGGDK